MSPITAVTSALSLALVSLFALVGPADGGRDAAPSLQIIGADAEVTALIEDAHARFVAAGLDLPDLEVHVHADRAGCGGAHGVFDADGSGGRIDVCEPGERLILHELAHAWSAVGLDDGERLAFVERVGLPSWNDHRDSHERRATEVAADAVAFGLMSDPLDADRARLALTSIEHYVFLVGDEPPRIDRSVAEIAALPVPTIAPDVVEMYSAGARG